MSQAESAVVIQGSREKLIGHRETPYIPPDIPPGYRIYNHDSGKDLRKWELDRIELIRFSEKAKNGRGQSVDVLWFLTKHPDCIPMSFRGKKVFFVETTFTNSPPNGNGNGKKSRRYMFFSRKTKENGKSASTQPAGPGLRMI